MDSCYYSLGSKCGVAVDFKTGEHMAAGCPCADYQTKPDPFWELCRNPPPMKITWREKWVRFWN